METDATMTSGKKPPSLPSALYLMRARSRTSKVLDLDSAASGPPTPPVTVPFLWEEAPGKPKLQETEASAPASAPAATASHPLLADGSARARPVPLKLPPRLQAAATAEYSLSPKTVLQGPYGAGEGKKPPRSLRRNGSTASYRRKPGAGGGLFSWRKPGAGGGLFSWRKATAAAGSKKDGHDHDAAAPDASCCSPAASSSSSSSMSYFGDDHGRGARRTEADVREDPDDGEEGEDGVKRTVRITRFRRNRSLPSMTTSHLWASIRKSVQQITPWS